MKEGDHFVGLIGWTQKDGKRYLMSVDLPWICRVCKKSPSGSRVRPSRDLIVIYNAGFGLGPIYQLHRSLPACGLVRALPVERAEGTFWGRIGAQGIRGEGAGGTTAAPEQRNPLGGSVQP